MIVIMAGLPGTGKSTVARSLAQRLPAAVLDKDIIRAALFSAAHFEYSREQDDFCQEIMLQTATYLLRKNSSLYVILDGRTFSQRYQRERVFKFCSQLGTRWAMLECVCSEQTALRRLEQAAVEQIHPAMNRTPALYPQIRKMWEPIDDPKLMIDTEASLNSCAERATQYLAQIAQQTPSIRRKLLFPDKRIVGEK
jgi:predicted kinase